MKKKQPENKEPRREFWARFADDPDEFTYGPYPSVYAACKVMEDIGTPGESFEVGRLVPFVPHIDMERVFERMVEDNSDKGIDEAWPSVQPGDIGILEARLDKVLMEWLEELGCVPHCGDIVNIEEFDLVGEQP